MDAQLVVGRNIARLRLEKGLSQTQLASLIDQKLSISQSYLSKVERGEKNVTIQTMAFIAKALGVRLVDLVIED